MFLFRKPTITRAKAIQIAGEVAKKENWPWEEPIDVSSGLTQWHVTTNTHQIGGNIRVCIHKRTGEVVYKGFAPR